MTGRAKKLIDELIKKKANGNRALERDVRIKLILKGIMPDEITDYTQDSDEMIKNIFLVAKQFNVELTN